MPRRGSLSARGPSNIECVLLVSKNQDPRQAGAVAAVAVPDEVGGNPDAWDKYRVTG